mmetsp:Transcript_9844/g.20892  ORF Transcript_9844/g.20892 Transcript_9844/m.20892 type:complete len:230 (-) Transcript_9844:1061-1750(-)
MMGGPRLPLGKCYWSNLHRDLLGNLETPSCGGARIWKEIGKISHGRATVKLHLHHWDRAPIGDFVAGLDLAVTAAERGRERAYCCGHGCVETGGHGVSDKAGIVHCTGLDVVAASLLVKDGDHLVCVLGDTTKDVLHVKLLKGPQEHNRFEAVGVAIWVVFAAEAVVALAVAGRIANVDEYTGGCTADTPLQLQGLVQATEHVLWEIAAIHNADTREEVSELIHSSGKG